ncbi:L-seryl-tRNA(Sec) selenium transferase [Planctomycetales bacterium 10988]|nr:L-seryl-tRNA(Sec) selenium transferase [Planctomycetales bacterium 10988]
MSTESPTQRAASFLKNLPSVNEILDQTQLRGLVDRFSQPVVVQSVRSVLTDVRDEVQSAASEGRMPNLNDLADRVVQRITRLEESPLRPVINATGILLHPTLGRPPLSLAALEAMHAVGVDYASIELDLVEGTKSPRIDAVEKLLCDRTGAEAALVVNNSSAATMLALMSLAGGKEVLVSRGEVVDLGSDYRLPNIIEAAGACLKDVGTTNGTTLEDYRQGIGKETGAILRVHSTNYLIAGKSTFPTMSELARLATEKNVPLLQELGAGALIDCGEFGLLGQPLAQDGIKAGASLVLFSGDKLLGGPQCGLIVGKKNLIEKMKKHPLYRSLRVDKCTLAGLAATLGLYQDPDLVKREIPLYQLLSTSIANLQNRADRLAPQLAALPEIKSAVAQEDVTYLTGAELPTQMLTTYTVALTPQTGTASQLLDRLRVGTPSLLARVQEDKLILDLKTVFPRNDSMILSAFKNLAIEPS